MVLSYKELDNKKKQIDSFRPLNFDLINNLEKWFKVELTYTSNAIEGNTLTRKETAVVVEKGLTIGGKSLIEHLEAINHAKALDLIHSLSESKKTIKEHEILSIHYAILKGIDDHNAGKYRNVAVRISGSSVVMPAAHKINNLMEEFINWLNNEGNNIHPVEKAALAHYKLVSIHPFTDGNGRTARLLMNLILIQNGYPPAIINNKYRLEYINALEKAQLGGNLKDYLNIIINAVDKSLEIYLRAIKDEEPILDKEIELLKIGQLAKKVNEPIPTIRYWTSLGLINIDSYTKSGYGLYNSNVIDIIEKIKALQKERYTLEEIKQKIHKGNI
ncbi:MAG: Fic family protein [Sphingobacteriia bacterium]|nr:Fic family protein [Sphingobacteriia bacterium]